MSRTSVALIIATIVFAGCSSGPPPKRYELRGQVLAIDPVRRELTVAHEDIPGLMPAMTMSYYVANAALLEGRTPGELITGTLELSDSTGKIIAITHTGTAPLPPAGTGSLAANLLKEGDPLPDVALIDQTDTRRPLSDWRGTLTVLTFVYTRCPLPTFCPLMDQNFLTLQGAIQEDTALKGKVRLVSVSFDPDHDTPAVLAAHARKLKADPAIWTWLTGDRVTVERLAARFGVSVIRSDDPVQITHGLRTAVIGADGRLLKTYAGNEWTPGTVLADLRAAAKRP